MSIKVSAGVVAPAATAPHSRRLFPWLTAGRILSSGPASGLRQRLKFFGRALRQPRLTHAWLVRLVQPDIAPLWVAHPRLATKLQRPYLCCAWTTLERFAALMGHYDALTRCFAPAARAAIYHGGLDLIRLTSSTSGRKLDVRLLYRDQFEKEGELTLVIHDVATGLILAGLTFSVVHNAGRRIIIIGGLQASPDPRMRDLIHAVAKEYHGLRPKALALWCLQELGALWQVGQIQAVGDEQHIYRHAHKRREFAASYDEFWNESDGRRLPGGGSWELPLQLRPRTREELKPSRRKAHERRYALLSALRPMLRNAAESLAPGSSAATVLAASPAEFVHAGRDPGSAPAVEAAESSMAVPVSLAA
jgi:uncharacterized protein VirK/YbjX